MTFYNIEGIIRPRTFPETYMQGLEFAYIINGYSLSSSIKSNPNSSKLYYLNSGLSFLPTDSIKSVANLFIFYSVFLKLKFDYL